MTIHNYFLGLTTYRALRWGVSTTPLFSVMSMTQCSVWMAIPHSWMSCESAEPTRVWSWTRDAERRWPLRGLLQQCILNTENVCYCACQSESIYKVKSAWLYVRVQYLQVVDQQLVESRISVEVDQETLVIHHSDSRGLQRNSQALQLLLTLLQENTYSIFNTKWLVNYSICMYDLS